MVEFGILAVFLFVLGIGGLIADYVFPHIGPLERYLESLPMFEDDNDFDEEPTSLLKEEVF